MFVLSWTECYVAPSNVSFVTRISLLPDWNVVIVCDTHLTHYIPKVYKN